MMTMTNRKNPDDQNILSLKRRTYGEKSLINNQIIEKDREKNENL